MIIQIIGFIADHFYIVPGILFLVGFILKKNLSWKKLVIITLLLCLPFVLFSLMFMVGMAAISNVKSFSLLTLLHPVVLIVLVASISFPFLFVMFGAVVADFINKRKS